MSTRQKGSVIPDPAARSPQGRRLPHELRRRQIADAALKIIADEGLRKFTAVAIAREIGTTDGNVFRHFTSKQAIVLAAVDRIEEILFGDPPASHADPLTRLGNFFRHRVATVTGTPGVARLLFSDDLAHAAGPEGQARVVALRRRSMAVVSGCLGEARRRKMLAPGVSPRVAELLVMGALMALLGGRRHAADPAAMAREAGRVWLALERFLRGRSAHNVSKEVGRS
jgi:AcrR family transcriptional regulator